MSKLISVFSLLALLCALTLGLPAYSQEERYVPDLNIFKDKPAYILKQEEAQRKKDEEKAAALAAKQAKEEARLAAQKAKDDARAAQAAKAAQQKEAREAEAAAKKAARDQAAAAKKSQTAGRYDDCTNCSAQGTSNLRDLQKIPQHVPPTAAQKTDPCTTCGIVPLDAYLKKNAKTAMDSNDPWSAYPEIANYSNSKNVNDMINYAKRKVGTYNVDPKTGKRKERWMCYLGVKMAALAGELVDTKPQGLYVNPKAKGQKGPHAVDVMKQHGFVNLLDTPEYSKIISSPSKAPKGAILIYDGGYRGGHIEIKTESGNSGSYVSDRNLPDSILGNTLSGRAGRSYKLVGVMIKPMGSKN